MTLVRRSIPTTTLRFVLSSALSLLGNSVAGVVLPLILLARTGDALAAGTLALVCAVPQMLVGLLGGALLDRVNRRNVSIVSDLVSAASVALLPIVDAVWGLSFGWFVALGLLGAIGDIPGMTARDTLLPAVVRRDGIDLQRFLGVSQSLESLVTIVGPALAAVLIGFAGDAPALWVTAALSCAAALVTFTLPRSVGCTGNEGKAPAATASGQPQGIVAAACSSLRDGVSVLFKDDRLLRASMLLAFGIVMVMGSFQGLVLPVHFTELGQPQLLGYVLSAMSAGLLVGSLGYTALARRLSRRAWFSSSLVGMAIGVVVMGLLPSYPMLLAGAAVLGVSAGPASALMGFFAFDRIPEANRGSALGTQNALVLVVAPVAVFLTSVVVEMAGASVGAVLLAGCWLAVTVWALASPSLRSMDQGTSPDAADPADRPGKEKAPSASEGA